MKNSDTINEDTNSPNSLSAFSKENEQESFGTGGKMIILDKRYLAKTTIYKAEDGQSREKPGTSSSVESEDSPRLPRRKETARRQLLGSIYTKHKTVGRSFSFVAGERPPVHIRFPKVNHRDEKNEERKQKSVKDPIAVKQISPRLSVPQSKRRHSKVSNSTTSSGLSNINSKPVHRSNSQKISLPDIIMDFNLEVNMAVNDKHHESMSLDSDSERNERLIGASYEDYLKPKPSLHNPYKAKHRPVTPGLLDSLNKLKLPSKVKTEQWLKSSQTVQKSYCAGSYKVGNLHHSNLTYPNWIYTDS